MWPGTFSKAAASLRSGGTAMFALLALAGDLGCSSGPSLVGAVSGIADGNMKAGILTSVIFPVTLIICLLISKKQARKNTSN
jgi:MFS-type transporter involved in bile tolerance (Atg22 family)